MGIKRCGTKFPESREHALAKLRQEAVGAGLLNLNFDLNLHVTFSGCRTMNQLSSILKHDVMCCIRDILNTSLSEGVLTKNGRAWHNCPNGRVILAALPTNIEYLKKTKCEQGACAKTVTRATTTPDTAVLTGRPSPCGCAPFGTRSGGRRAACAPRREGYAGWAACKAGSSLPGEPSAGSSSAKEVSRTLVDYQRTSLLQTASNLTALVCPRECKTMHRCGAGSAHQEKPSVD